MAEKQKKILLCAIVLLYTVLFFIFITSYAFDDLGFDFAGYALRYKFAFSGWIKNLWLGMPAGTFDGELPSLLPLVFQSLGFGSFTLPVTLSVFALQLLVPVVFLFIGRLFGIGWKKSVLLGLLFVLNPFTFKFFNRYYEFAAWFLFFVSFYFYYKFLESKGFDKKNFAFAVLASSAMVLSHPSLILFWGIAFAALLLDFVDLKRFAAIVLFTAGIMAFWLLPFFGFSSLSIVSMQKGSELMTTGIRASNYFFALAMPLILLVFHRNIRHNARVFRFFLIATIIAVAYAIAPAALPLLNVPFAHSFHVFFFFAIVLALMQLLKNNVINSRHVAIAGIAAISCVALFFPVVARQFVFQEPRYSNYEFGGQRINYSEFEALLQKIPKNARFETLPSDMVIYARANSQYGLMSLRGWGYNAYALKESNEIGAKLTGMNISCSEFVAGSEKTATAYWIALNETGQEFLENCGLRKKIGGKIPSLYLLDSNNIGLVDGAELLDFENTFLKFRTTKQNVLVKVSWFPRWHAYSGGKELPIENANPGMIVHAQPGSIVELRYEKAGIDFAGIIISIIALILFVLALV